MYISPCANTFPEIICPFSTLYLPRYTWLPPGETSVLLLRLTIGSGPGMPCWWEYCNAIISGLGSESWDIVVYTMSNLSYIQVWSLEKIPGQKSKDYLTLINGLDICAPPTCFISSFAFPSFLLSLPLLSMPASFCKGYCSLRIRKSLQPHQEQSVQATRLKLGCLLHWVCFTHCDVWYEAGALWRLASLRQKELVMKEKGTRFLTLATHG